MMPLDRQKNIPPNWPMRSIQFFGLMVIALLCLAFSGTGAQAKKDDIGASAGSEESARGAAELLFPVPDPWKGDFDGMRERRQVRILVPLSKTFFFPDKARYRGTAHDLGKEFEKWLNTKYKQKAYQIHILFIPTGRDRLLPDLVDGLGDIVFGNLTITPERSKLVDFSRPKINNVKEVIVTGPSSPELNSIDDLSSKIIYVRKSSSYYEHLLDLNKKFKSAGKKAVKLKAGDEHLEDEDLLEMLNAGLIPMVVVDDHKANFWAQIFPDITVRNDLAVHEGGQIAWAVRKNSPLLLAEVNGFIDQQVNRKGLGNIVLKRYLKSTKYVKSAVSQAEMEKFNQVVALFKKYGARYEFEHLMLMAQGYQESRLDQKAVSPVGAVGIMQVLPSTAENPPINIADVEKNPENNIHAGTKYLRWLIDTYLDEPGIDRQNELLLAFAAYNAGPGNLRKFRRLTEKSGLDPDIWFDNVEHAAARIIGRETVQYVGNIYKYYIAYKLTEERQALQPAQTSK